MTTCVYLLDVPENTTVVKVAAEDPATVVDKVGPYFRVISQQDIVIDRRATGVRHAVWYSCVAGLTGSRITQWDKDALRIGAAG
jgi:hypothetical protein